MSKISPTDLDDLLLSRTRLGILSALLGGDALEFTCLRDELEVSDGNLSVQLRKLEDAGYIKIKKLFVKRKPKTMCRITSKGRQAMEALVKHLERLFESRPPVRTRR
jgi:DNA-binding MarR family transcriptional regulator